MKEKGTATDDRRKGVAVEIPIEEGFTLVERLKEEKGMGPLGRLGVVEKRREWIALRLVLAWWQNLELALSPIP